MPRSSRWFTRERNGQLEYVCALCNEVVVSFNLAVNNARRGSQAAEHLDDHDCVVVMPPRLGRKIRFEKEDE